MSKDCCYSLCHIQWVFPWIFSPTAIAFGLLVVFPNGAELLSDSLPKGSAEGPAKVPPCKVPPKFTKVARVSWVLQFFGQMRVEPHAVGDILLPYSINWLWLASNFSESQEFRDLEFESQDLAAMAAYASALSVYQRLAEWQQALRLLRQLECMEVRFVKPPTNHSGRQLFSSNSYQNIFETQVLWTQKQLPKHQKHLYPHHSVWPLVTWKWEGCKTCSAFCKKPLPRYTTRNMLSYQHTNISTYTPLCIDT